MGMKDEIKVKQKIERNGGNRLLGSFIKGDKKSRFYSVLLVVSLVIMVISFVFLNYAISIYFLVPSFILFLASLFEIASRISSLNAKLQAPDSTGDESFYTFSTNWSEIKTWKPFLAGLILIGISLALDQYSISGIFVLVNPTLFVSGIVIILLGGFVLYLKFLSR